MKSELWNDRWKFWLDKNAFALVWDIPAAAREVTLPHDAMREQPANPQSPNGGNTGFRDGATCVYVKNLHAPLEWREKTVRLQFEGVYCNAFVYVNGQLAAKNPNGYTTFFAPLENYLRYGQDNEIRVFARSGGMPNSRWYSGSGIYRDVYLLTGGMTCLQPEGLQIATEQLDGDLAVLRVKAELANRAPNPVEAVLELKLLDAAGRTAAEETVPVSLTAGGTRTIARRVTVEKPRAWSAEDPALYRCTARLRAGDALLDESETTFGIRTLALDARRGLRVNGRTVKLLGACIHHDSGLLGAATYEDAQYRQIALLRAAGFNAVRMSHHPMAPAMLRACDAIGMYVMDETYDMWTRAKSDLDYHMSFGEYGVRDAQAMARKDYNHPSVVLYSVGNEIPEIGTPQGSRIAGMICEAIRAVDDTRFLTAGINGVFAAGDQIGRIIGDLMGHQPQEAGQEGNVNDFMTVMDTRMDEIVTHPAVSERLEMACAPLDAAGYNYMTARYVPDGAQYPNRVIVGSETYPPEFARNWALVQSLGHVIGDFTWTGWDYIGEAGVGVAAYRPGEGGFGAQFPCQLAYAGDLDITGFRRPVSYYREIAAGLRKAPYIAVQNPHHYGERVIKTPWVLSDSLASWTWQGMAGRPVVVEVYAPGEEVALYCNDTLVGRQPAGAAAGYIARFDTVYRPGTLRAVCYAAGRELSSDTLATAGAPAAIALAPERRYGAAAAELCYLDVTLTDGQGRAVTDADRPVRLAVTGPAELIGFGSGNPKPTENYDTDTAHTFHGRALAILRRTGCGEVTVSASDGTGLAGGAAFQLP